MIRFRRAALMLGFVVLSGLVLGVVGLVVEETTDLNPTPIVVGGGALDGMGLMLFARRLDVRDR